MHDLIVLARNECLLRSTACVLRMSVVVHEVLALDLVQLCPHDA